MVIAAALLFVLADTKELASSHTALGIVGILLIGASRFRIMKT